MTSFMKFMLRSSGRASCEVTGKLQPGSNTSLSKLHLKSVCFLAVKKQIDHFAVTLGSYKFNQQDATS